MRVRCTWLRLGAELRWAAGGVEADDGRRVEALRFAREIGDEDMQVRRRNDLWRLADRLDQKLADFAGVAIGIATAGGDDLARGRVIVVVVVRMTAAVGVVRVMVRRASDDVNAMVVAVVGREPVQALTEKRNAGVGSQQRAGQEFAKGVAHAGRCGRHGGGTVKCIVGTGSDEMQEKNLGCYRDSLRGTAKRVSGGGVHVYVSTKRALPAAGRARI